MPNARGRCPDSRSGYGASTSIGEVA
jgi:hypothetical protein